MSDLEVSVRPYDMARDFDALVRIYEDAEDHHGALDPEPPMVPRDVEGTRRRFRELDLANPDRALLVAETGEGEVVGLIEATMHRDDNVGFTGTHVDLVCVAAAHRGRGVGTRLMAEVERWAVANGAMSLRLDVYVFNAGAQRLYRRLGYETRALSMAKRLP